jgi:hypothetical protein
MTDFPKSGVSIKGLLESGTASMKSSKFRRITNGLKWRQKFLGADTYPIELLGDMTISLRQIKNGEITGVGTGCSVWPAAHVLCKYFEKCFGPDGLRGKR